MDKRLVIPLWEDIKTQEEVVAVKKACEQSLLFFTAFFFRQTQGQQLVINWHHRMFAEVGHAIYDGDLQRVIINCPPGSTKTELFSISFPAWGIARCITEGRPSRWLPLSYSDELVEENSYRAREIIELPAFASMWPYDKGRIWKRHNWTIQDKQHGNYHRIFGVSTGGQVTGRRAGYMREGFTGALVVDDPQSTQHDIGKHVHNINSKMGKVVRSRLAHDDIPIIVIQQRVARNDVTGFLLGDGSPDDWAQIKIPAVIDREYIDNFPEPHKSRIISDTDFTGLPTSYWPSKEPTTTLMAIKDADTYLYHSQYQQEPDEAFLPGVIYREEVEELIADGRVCHIPIEKSLQVYTFWDLGRSKGNEMSIWLMQPIGFELRLIAFKAGNQASIEPYINWLHEFRSKYGIEYAKHYGPHDLAVKELFGSGKSRQQVAADMGLDFHLIPRPGNKVADSIDALRPFFRRIFIDPDRCDIDCLDGKTKVRGWEALKKYQREYDADNEVFRATPLHNWASNPADALQLLGMAWVDEHKESDDDNPFVARNRDIRQRMLRSQNNMR